MCTHIYVLCMSQIFLKEHLSCDFIDCMLGMIPLIIQKTTQ